jgi:hypothetical protein
MARLHTKAIIASLAGIATKGSSESARVAACEVLLERGWGKVAQTIQGDESGGPLRIVIRKILNDGMLIENDPLPVIDVATGGKDNEE